MTIADVLQSTFSTQGYCCNATVSEHMICKIFYTAAWGHGCMGSNLTFHITGIRFREAPFSVPGRFKTVFFIAFSPLFVFCVRAGFTRKRKSKIVHSFRLH